MSEKTVEELAKQLGDEDTKARMEAAVALRKAVKAGKDISAAVPELGKVFSYGDKKLFENTAWALVGAAKKGANVSAVVPDLIAALSYKNEGIREVAASALSGVAAYGADISAATPGLIAALSSPHRTVRTHAVHCLEYVGPRNYADVRMLLNLGREARRKGKPTDGYKRVYQDWMKKLNKSLQKITLDNKFKFPRVRDLKEFERVLRMRRVRG